MEGFSTPTRRSDRVVLEANPDYWDKSRFPRIKRIVFDNTIGHKEAIEMIKTGEGHVDMVTELSPLDTLRVAESPFAKVVKNRKTLTTVFGFFNMRKAESPWLDIRLRKAMNMAINRADLIRYATKGNGVIIPALISVKGFGYDPDLKPYPFDPDEARRLLRAAGYPEGRDITLLATEDLNVQATVVSNMLKYVGLRVKLRILDAAAFNSKTFLSDLDQPPERQSWDIALMSYLDFLNFPPFEIYHNFALDGTNDWLEEQPQLQQLYAQVLSTVDQQRQLALIRQMERHTRDQAYFLFLYNPIQLYAVNKAVTFVPYISALRFAQTTVSAQHWSVRKQKAAVQK